MCFADSKRKILSNSVLETKKYRPTKYLHSFKVQQHSTMSLSSFGAGRFVRGSLCSSYHGRSFVRPSSFSFLNGQQRSCATNRQILLAGNNGSKRCFSSGKQQPPNNFEKIIKVTRNQQQPQEPEVKLTMLQKFLGPKPMPERHTAAWYGEMLLICTVFAITGSSTMLLVS